MSTNRLPYKMLFLPEPKKGFRGGLFNPMKELLWHKTRLFFVCSLSHRPGQSGEDQQGYVLKFDTALLRGLKPLLALSAIVLKAALSAYGIPFPLPEGVTNMMYVDAVSEFVCKQLEDSAGDKLDDLRKEAETRGDHAALTGAAIDGSLQQVYEMLLRYSVIHVLSLPWCVVI